MKKIDLNSIQELKNENDAYYMDKNGNIGILKFVGECDGSYYKGQRSRLYKLNGKLEYIVTHKDFKEIDFFGDHSSMWKNNALFSKLGGDCHNSSHMFIPNREALEWLSKVELGEDKKVFCVSESLYTFIENYDLAKEYKHTKIFDDKKDAIEYYDVLKNEILEKLSKYLEKSTSIFTNIENFLNSKNINDEEKLDGIRAKDAKCGIKYHLKNLYNEYVKRTVIIDHIDKDGVGYLTNGKVLSPDKMIASEEVYDKIQTRNKYEDLIRSKWEIERFIEKVKSYLSDLSKDKPFSKESFSVDTKRLEGWFNELTSINIEKVARE